MFFLFSFHSKEAIHKPVTLNCGHSSCMTCLHKLFEKGLSPCMCPFCRKVVDQSERDNMKVDISLNLLVGRINIWCKTFGCGWNGKKNSKKEVHSQECLFKIKDCRHDGCYYATTRRRITEHDESCPMKRLPCNYCDKVITTNEMPGHKATCQERPEQCLFGCEVHLPRYVYYTLKLENEITN